MTLPAVFGLAGTALAPAERAFFGEADPAGYILFGRNCADPAQLRALTDELRALAGRDVAILIDQEGGRVARLKPPHWPSFPAAAAFAKLYRIAPMSAIEAARANAAAMGHVLGEAGVTMNCAPVLDLGREDRGGVVGDRALGTEPMQVAALGRAMLDGLTAGGVAACVKHIPGHGCADADSHEKLPVVDSTLAELEPHFAPFRALRAAPAAMVAHILYTALDAERPASASATVIAGTIRRDIGFDGLLLSDDIVMGALDGGAGARARAVVDAGCDLALHCSGVLAEMEEVAAALGGIGEQAWARLARAMPPAGAGGASCAELLAKRDRLLAYG